MIRTTVVGSYPVPLWLRVMSTRESLRDAVLAVLRRLGADAVCTFL